MGAAVLPSEEGGGVGGGVDEVQPLLRPAANAWSARHTGGAACRAGQHDDPGASARGSPSSRMRKPDCES